MPRVCIKPGASCIVREQGLPDFLADIERITINNVVGIEGTVVQKLPDGKWEVELDCGSNISASREKIVVHQPSTPGLTDQATAQDNEGEVFFDVDDEEEGEHGESGVEGDGWEPVDNSDTFDCRAEDNKQGTYGRACLVDLREGVATLVMVFFMFFPMEILPTMLSSMENSGREKYSPSWGIGGTGPVYGF